MAITQLTIASSDSNFGRDNTYAKAHIKAPRISEHISVIGAALFAFIKTQVIQCVFIQSEDLIRNTLHFNQPT